MKRSVAARCLPAHECRDRAGSQHRVLMSTSALLACSPLPPCQELVRDDNAAHAALLLPLPDRCCLYRFRAPSYYSECLCLGLEWDRGAHTFR